MFKTVVKKSSHLQICECWKQGQTERGKKSTCKSGTQKRHLVSGCTRSALCLQICGQQQPQGRGLGYHAVAGLVWSSKSRFFRVLGPPQCSRALTMQLAPVRCFPRVAPPLTSECMPSAVSSSTIVDDWVIVAAYETESVLFSRSALTLRVRKVCRSVVITRWGYVTPSVTLAAFKTCTGASQGLWTNLSGSSPSWGTHLQSVKTN